MIDEPLRLVSAGSRPAFRRPARPGVIVIRLEIRLPARSAAASRHDSLFIGANTIEALESSAPATGASIGR